MKQPVFNPEARERLVKGMGKLATGVMATMGPGGRNINFINEYGYLCSTKDGVTVAKQITDLEDPIEDMGARMLREAALKTAEEAGDGTTTSTVLAYKLAQWALDAVAKGHNAVELKKGMEAAGKQLVGHLKKMARNTKGMADLHKIASLSSNGDTELADLIVAGIEHVGTSGIVTIEETRYGDTRLDKVEGLQFNRGYKSHHFVTDQEKMIAALDDALVLIVDHKLYKAEQLLPVMEYVVAENKPLLVIAEDIESEALATLIVNKVRGGIRTVAVKAPEFGEKRKAVLEDIAIITGGQVISLDKGMNLAAFTPDQADWLGKVRRVVAKAAVTTLIDGAGDSEVITDRITKLDAQLAEVVSDYDRESLKTRIGQLAGGVAVIHIGGKTDIEIKERKDRAEDALFATYSAMAEGYLAGGGTALLRAAEKLTIPTPAPGESQRKGYELIKTVCAAPFWTILRNAGYEDGAIAIHEAEVIASRWEVLNPLTGQLVKADKAGIIDPLKVTRSAIENAIATAGMILLTEGVIITHKDPAAPAQPAYENPYAE